MNINMENQITELLSKMTLTEKIGQLNQIAGRINDDILPNIKQQIRDGKVGSIILANSATAGNDAQSNVDVELYNELQRVAVEESRLGIPMIYGRDVIHGHRTAYPIPLASAATFNCELTEKCYRNIAEEAAADGIHWTFSPMLDVCRDPRWGRIIEGTGEDPYLSSCMARAFVKGFQGDDLTDKKSIVACAKHFLGYGFSEGGRDYHRTEISDYTIYNSVLPAFRSAVDAGVMTFMSSFNDINGIPTTGSKKYLTDILRGELGFEGFVVSDWGAVEQLERQGVCDNRAECAKTAVEAGLDLNMFDGCYIENLEDLVNSGEVSSETIDLAVRRILRVKLAIGLFEHPYAETIEYDRAAHRKDAREYAAESMVLLQNNGTLPLSKNSKIALLGPYACDRVSLLGSWSLDSRGSETTNLYEALKEVVGDNIFVSNSCDFDYKVRMNVLKSDVVVLALGEYRNITGEKRSVSDIELEADQRALIDAVAKLGKKVIAVLFCGRPRSVENVKDKLDSILYAWHSGSEAARATCDILFGDVIPSGKTPVTFPKESGHIPLYYNVTSSGRPVNGYYNENPLDNYTDSIATPLYPFGYGLSYTNFEYSEPVCENRKITLDSLKQGENFKVSVQVKNTGNFDGKETVQLYIRDVKSRVMRPLRELKGFQKLLIEHGKSATVDFCLDYRKLGYYLENGEYIVESGEFEVYVGDNCLTENKILITVL